MKILLTCSENYAPHAATLMEELLAHSSVPLGFAFLYVSFSGEVMGKLTHHFSTRVESLEFHRVDPALVERISDPKSSYHLPAEAYLRLFAPLYLKDEKVLYLDIDIICRGDIAPIMDEVTEPACLHAVKHYDEHYYQTIGRHDARFAKRWSPRRDVSDSFFQELFDQLELSRPARYFNAGVMVLDLDKWREDRITDKLLEYIASVERLHHHDQDALNHVLDGRFGALHPRWNSTGGACRATRGYSPEQLRDARRHPVLRHFTGYKPWSWVRLLKFDGAHRYWKYRRRTPWPAWHPSEPLRKVVKDLYWEYCKRFWKRSR